MGWLLPLLSVLVIIGGWMYMFVRQNRERDANAPLRDEIRERVCLSTRLDHVSKLGEGGFRGTPGMWIRFKGPKRLVVGADAFMISMPQAFREYVFSGRESSIAVGQAPSGLAERDWIIITGQADGRQVQIAITKKEGLPEIWRALAGTGAAIVLPIRNYPVARVRAGNPQLRNTWSFPAACNTSSVFMIRPCAYRCRDATDQVAGWRDL